MSRSVRLGLLVALTIGALCGARLTGLDQVMTLEGMRRVVSSWGDFAPLVYVGICFAGILLYLPESLLLGIGGALFGGCPAALYGWIGGVLGTTLTFVIVRYLAHDYVQRNVASRWAQFRRLDDRLAQGGFRWMLMLRVVLGLAPVLNWTTGATSIRLGSHFGATALGVIPGVLLYAYFGGSIAHAVETGNWLTPHVLVPAALAAMLAAGAVLLGRRLLAAES